jgi:hypothetical protein
MMDVEPHREALFNDLYDNEHLPLALPGSVNAVWYRTKTLLRLRLRGRAHRPASWLRGSDLNRRPLGYEPFLI